MANVFEKIVGGRDFSLPPQPVEKVFSAGWQRSRKPQRQANRTRRRTGGTVEGGLRSKSKCLAQQAFYLFGAQLSMSKP